MLVQILADPRQNVDFVEIYKLARRPSCYAEVSLCPLQESGNQMHCSLVSCFTSNQDVDGLLSVVERGPADAAAGGLEYAAIRNVEQCNWFILLQHNIIYYALPLLLLIIDEIVIILSVL